MALTLPFQSESKTGMKSITATALHSARSTDRRLPPHDPPTHTATQTATSWRTSQPASTTPTGSPAVGASSCASTGG